MNTALLNPFAWCSWLLRKTGNVMLVVTIGIFATSMYHTNLALTRHLHGAQRPLGSTSLLVGLGLVLVNALCLLALWSYFTCLVTDPGRVPSGWHPFESSQQAQAELSRLLQGGHRRQAASRYNPFAPRYCRKCQSWKPPRAHHCSALGRCVLRMDHYCVWVVNTVGLLNYKGFMLFVVYTWLAAFVGALIQLQWVLETFRSDDASAPSFLIVTFCIDGAMAISLTAFMLIHLNMVFKNKTSIEMWEKDSGSMPWPFDRGWRRNTEEIFGRNPLRWGIPYHTKLEREQMIENELQTQTKESASSPVSNGHNPTHSRGDHGVRGSRDRSSDDMV